MYCYGTESEQQFLDDDQARQIYTAFEIGSQINDPGDLLRHSILKRGGLTPETEAQALNFLIKSKVRQQLSKQGLAFPTRNSFVERIHVEKLSDREWNVWNRSRGTNYLVEDGLQDGLICSCESRTGFCKHRDAVRALLDATQPLNPPRISQPEISEPLEFSDFEDPTINDKDFDPVDDKDCQYWAPYLPDGMIPTPGQIRALSALAKWWKSATPEKYEPFFRLKGFAGTGKTVISTAFYKWLQVHTLPPRVCFSAPFNKANWVQREKLDAADVYADVFTCSSLLGVRRQTSEDEEFFYKDSRIEAKVHDYGLVIIDEISTINRSLWGWIKEAADAGRFFMKPRFVLMGDEAQLPPVKECESEAFRIQCPSAQLTQIMRHDGPIAAYVTTIRSVLESRPPHAVQIVRDGRGIWVTEDDDLWFKRMKSGFTSAGYADDPSYCRAIAWTNARVNYLNSKIRAFLGRRGEWEVGERIMANAPYGLDPEDGPVLHNSEEATVQYVKEGASQGWPVWWLSLLKDNDQTEIIPVLQKTAEREFKKELDTLRRQSRWQSFWALKESMADISYGYAMTSHKAQGSTFQNVWADMRNLRRNPKVNTTTEGRRIPEVTQLAYVAATRAAQRLFILE